MSLPHSYSTPINTTPWFSVSSAFARAVVSQLQPRMIFALLMPFFFMLVGFILLSWLLWTPVQGWLTQVLTEWNLFDNVDQWLVSIGLFSLKLYLAPLLALGVLLPLAGVIGLVLAAVLVMPMVLRHVSKKDYPELQLRGRHATAMSVWNAIWVGTIFVVGWLVTLPLWLFPPFALILPVFWWTFAFTLLLRVDALVEHADASERKYLWRRLKLSYWTIGLVIALLNLFPPAWLILPVFSALVFAHFSLENLRRLRAVGSSVLGNEDTVMALRHS
ncbi:EI24 domain-containing protein [Alcaligenes endophyticus]|uniref:EI24 domain-containing protein n=1 Tax=Alcaligenes endophyticus TaxID=1929088 RepID=A0ABT8EH68_9BURK|nr:EI24 domain-containing protein [Alcaligenes endophyticus]MCX5589720.1 EI24 domain-containing protein [Alcaligenes endophyticus]MDN4120616.1 EI24 domain-containing protein [Alcaligenes endophyticus]